MRWIDIILPEPGINQQLDESAGRGRAAMADASPRSRRATAWTPSAVDRRMAEVGQPAVPGRDRRATPRPSRPITTAAERDRSPRLDRSPEHDDLVGYHLRGRRRLAACPGPGCTTALAFLLREAPHLRRRPVGSRPARRAARPALDAAPGARPLPAGRRRSSRRLRGHPAQLRPTDARPPEMLFVPGHTDANIRRLIYREAEAIQAALEGTARWARPWPASRCRPQRHHAQPTCASRASPTRPPLRRAHQPAGRASDDGRARTG